jgi:NADPH-ferrihemoprotein reductase
MEEAHVEEFTDEEHMDKDTGTARAIVLAATYGEGEPTDNSVVLVQSLKEQMGGGSSEGGGDEAADPVSTFKGLDYCVFGLANRQYEHFNAMGAFFDSALEKLGGNRIVPLGVGDDDADLEADFESWKETMWVQLKRKYLATGADFKAKRSAISDALPECVYVIEYHSKDTKAKDLSMEQVHGSSRHYFTAVDCPVTTIRELRSPDDGGSTVHVEIDISKAKGLEYQTADNLGVLPVNDSTVVESVAASLGYDLDAVFSVKAAPKHEWHGAPFPMPITVRECLSLYCDLTSAPRRSDLKLLVNYAKDPTDRKALVRLSTKEGKKEYKEKIMEGYVGLVDLLKLCPSLSIPLEHLIPVSRRLLPRYFTISSSSSVQPNSVHLTAAVTEHNRRDGSLFKGVCSTHLAGQKPGKDTIRVFSRPSSFRLPKDSSRPIIMIGPGTGVAPMRGLLQERGYQKSIKKETVGPNLLYFGCKNSSLDYLYADELKGFLDEGVLDKLYVAFSRVQKEKVYVQHLLAKNAKETWNLIDAESASIYVCGGVKMGHDVTEALKVILSTEGRMSLADAKDYLGKLASDGRFVQELWA